MYVKRNVGPKRYRRIKDVSSENIAVVNIFPVLFDGLYDLDNKKKLIPLLCGAIKINKDICELLITYEDSYQTYGLNRKQLLDVSDVYYKNLKKQKEDRKKKILKRKDLKTKKELLIGALEPYQDISEPIKVPVFKKIA